MTSALTLLKLHIQKQVLPYLFPMILTYGFLLPYQKQLLFNINEKTMIQVFDSAQEYLFLSAVWFPYLGLRIVFNSDLREASVSYVKKMKGKWMLSNSFFYFLYMLPYAVWVILSSGNYYKNMLLILIQCMAAEAMAFFLMYILRSAMAGFAVMAVYYVLCVNHVMAEWLCIIQLGILPENYGFGRFVWTLVLKIFLILH